MRKISIRPPSRKILDTPLDYPSFEAFLVEVFTLLSVIHQVFDQPALGSFISAVHFDLLRAHFALSTISIADNLLVLATNWITLLCEGSLLISIVL